MHGTEGRTGSDASPLHGAARTGKPLRLHGVARMYGCCLTANRTSILQQNLSHRDPNEPGSARPAVRELHSSTDLHGMPDLDHCTELHGTHAAALQASRGSTSLHGSFLLRLSSDRSASRAMPKARLTYSLSLTVEHFTEHMMSEDGTEANDQTDWCTSIRVWSTWGK